MPDDFAVVPAAFLTNKSPVVPKVENFQEQRSSNFEAAVKEDEEWTKKISVLLADNSKVETEMITWSAFHAERESISRKPVKTALLPLFYENAHTVEMVKHGMNVTKDAINHLNPSQVKTQINPSSSFFHRCIRYKKFCKVKNSQVWYA